MTQSQEWEKAVHERIAAAIQNAREGQLTAQQLAEETKRLGYPISRSQIANYEVGRKKGLDVTELLVIAAALGVEPMSLLYPGKPDEQVEVLPGQWVSTLEAQARFGADVRAIKREAAGLIEQLGRIERAIPASFASEGSFNPTVKAVHSDEQETK